MLFCSEREATDRYDVLVCRSVDASSQQGVSKDGMSEGHQLRKRG
jgi:hypothetical protein